MLIFTTKIEAVLMIALDCETGGVDFYHGAMPFFVTVCTEDGDQQFWEWAVDPKTRKTIVPPGDAEEIQAVIDDADEIVGQNIKFDATALGVLGIVMPWEKVHDTLLAGHLLASNQPHDLTSMAMQYLGIDIEPWEKDLERAVQEARRLCRSKAFISKHGEWMIAEKGLPVMPSAKEKTWRYDYWLPRAVAEIGEGKDGWATVLRDYANADSAVTLPLWKVMRDEIDRRGLREVHESRRALSRISQNIERRGVTISKQHLGEIEKRYANDSRAMAERCSEIAAQYHYPLELPKGASPNNSLRAFCFDVLMLPPMRSKNSKTDAPTLDKQAMDHYEATLEDGDGLEFIKSLKGKRARDTALAYLDGYKRFWLPLNRYDGCNHCKNGNGEHKGSWFKLHPSLNPTGTDTLRWSSSNPNAQNISKRESFNLRYCFGPAPGREWWSMDGKNLELRIPAYESGEVDLVYVFDHPDDPPYYGSYHLVVFDVLHPKLFAEHGKKVKDLFESSWYQWVKNGNFAIIYGAQLRTADAAYHVAGAYDKIGQRFPKIAALNEKYKTLANRWGYVETIPDRDAHPNKGYPILCSRSESGAVMPTTPLNYHVSGTAMQWTCKGMIRCDAQLASWAVDGFDGFMTMQVHDELVFDFPKGIGAEPWKTNLPKARKLKRLMENGGRDIGVPTPTSIEYHSKSWDKGEVMT